MATTQNLGPVSVIPMGDWNASTTYPRLSIVRSYGGSYLCNSSNTGIQPGVSPGWENSWMLLNQDVYPDNLQMVVDAVLAALPNGYEVSY